MQPRKLRDIRALWFLSWRSFVGGLKRAVSSGRRLIAYIFSALWLLWIVGSRLEFGNQTPKFDFAHGTPKAVVLMWANVAVFAAFVVTVLFSPVGARRIAQYRQSDVDVLLPTPVSSRTVLVLAILREAVGVVLGTLISSVFLMEAVGAGEAIAARSFNATSYTFVILAFALLTLSLVAANVALRILVHFKPRLSLTINAVKVAIFLAICVHALLLFETETIPAAFGGLGTSPLERILILPAGAAAALAFAPVSGSWLVGMAGGAILIWMGVAAFRFAEAHSDQFYDLIATRAGQGLTTRAMQRSGDVYAIAALRAQKAKRRRFGGLAGWISKWSFKRDRALLQRNLILVARTSAVAQVLVALVIDVIGAFLIDQARQSGTISRGVSLFSGLSLLISLPMIVIPALFALQVSASMLEFVRRIDFDQPLPVSPAMAILWIAVANAAVSLLMEVLAGVVLICVWPTLVVGCASALLVVISLTLLIASGQCIVGLLFPDAQDAAMRSLRGLLGMLALMISATPSIVIVGIGLLLHLNPILLGLASLVANATLSGFALMLAGRLYDGFNPTD